MKHIVHRLLPNQDIKPSLVELCESHRITSAVLVMGIGSVSSFRLRVSDGKSIIESDEAWEIVSLSGTISKGKVHIHISLSGQDGHVVGGHLMDKTIVKTTVELYIQGFDHLTFNREFDEKTGYDELIVNSKDG